MRVVQEAKARRRQVKETLAERKAVRKAERDSLAKGIMPETLKNWRVSCFLFSRVHRHACKTLNSTQKQFLWGEGGEVDFLRGSAGSGAPRLRPSRIGG